MIVSAADADRARIFAIKRQPLPAVGDSSRAAGLTADPSAVNESGFLPRLVRLRYGTPSLPAELPEPMKLAAKLSHYAFYVLMIGMPLIGWGMLSAADYPVVLFGGAHLPAILPQSDGLHALLWNAHFYLAFVFFALILLHVAAALFHALVRRDGVFDAMAPVSTRHEVAPAE